MSYDYEHEGLQTNDPNAILQWRNILEDSEKKEKEWIKNLREKGFKAAHPNDGWVDREKNRVHFAYPQFDDNPQVGDLIMLGWDCGMYDRIVRVIKIEDGILGGKYFYFKDEVSVEV